MLILRTSDKERQAYGGFQWPLEVGATVGAPDWNPKPECGNGLHGLAWGCGSAGAFSFNKESLWYVVEADDATVVDLGNKVKFPECVVRLVTKNRDEAIAYLDANGAADKPVVFARRMVGDGQMVMVGDKGTATAGVRGTATAGYKGTATAGIGGTATTGNYGTATAGQNGTATAGHDGTATAGNYGTATAGIGGTATAGNYGTATAGDEGTATTGHYGTATAGDYGTATAGDGGTATADDYGTATAGDYGTSIVGAGGKASTGIMGQIIARYWNGGRDRTAVFYEGEDYEANRKYTCDTHEGKATLRLVTE